MALFGNKTKKQAAPAKKEAKEKKTSVRESAGEKALANSRLEDTLRAPWLSEKALIGTEKGVYVFAVPRSATKTHIRHAVERIYQVVPVKVNIVNLPPKSKPMRSRRGYGLQSARHKAYVYLKKGDSIQF